MWIDVSYSQRTFCSWRTAGLHTHIDTHADTHVHAHVCTQAKEAELDGTATQSSEGWSGRPSRAIDGNTNQNYGKASCSHTAIGDKVRGRWIDSAYTT